MMPVIILLSALLLVGTILYLTDKKPVKSDADVTAEDATQTADCTADCCATNDVCPSELLLKAACNDIVYYDDEELDQFKDRQAEDYTPDELEQFRDVLYTLKPQELLPWRQALKKRGIMLPQPLHDEFIMLYNETASSGTREEPARRL